MDRNGQVNRVRVQFLNRKDIEENIYELARLRIEVFKEFPYLYDGDIEYEKKYLKVYLESQDSAVIAAFDDNKIIGASTCLPLKDCGEATQKPFLEKKLNLEEYFYFGESVLDKNYRGLGIGHKFFDLREEHALGFHSIRYTTFCAVMRKNHPLMPIDYKSHDIFWSKRGYKKNDDLISYFDWKDVDEKQETSKPLVFWIKHWSKK